ncbi:hypothetical protein D3C85_1147060 [compost metagenome]
MTGGATFRRELPVLALVTEHIASPGLLDDLQRLLEDFAVQCILLIASLGVHRSSGADTRTRGQGIHPARMVTTGETDHQATLEHVVKGGNFFGNAHRVMRRQGVTHDTGLHPLGMQAHIETEHPRVVVDLETFDLQVMLRLAIACIAKTVSQAHVIAHLGQKTLVQLWALAGHTGFQLMATTDHAGLHQVEFHMASWALVVSVSDSQAPHININVDAWHKKIRPLSLHLQNC